MALLPYYTYLVLCENLFIIGARWTALVLIGRLFYRIRFHPQSLRVNQLSLAMYTYLGTHMFGAIVSTPYLLYKIFWWQWPPNRIPGKEIYDLYLLFWLGLFDMSYLICSPVPVLFLTLDRICSLKPTTWIGLHKQSISKFGIVLTVIFFLVTFFLYCVQELPLNTPLVALCELSPCLMTKSVSVPELGIKMAFGTTNLISSIVFLVMLRKASNTGQMAVANRVVNFSIVCEICLDLIPTYTGFLFNKMAGVSGSTYIGDYVGMPVAGEAAMIGIYYWRTMTKKCKNSEQTGAEQKTNGVFHMQHSAVQPHNPAIVIQRPTSIMQNTVAKQQELTNNVSKSKNKVAPIRVQFRNKQ